MTLIQTLLKPDREELEMKERLVVISAANTLQVGEFQLLQRAHRKWFNKDLPEALVARLFTAYMLRNEVPHWARHYARRIIAMDTAGTLDDHNPAYHRFYPAVPHQRHGGVGQFSMATAAVMICVFGRLWISHQAASNGTSYLPSYFDERELKTTR